MHEKADRGSLWLGSGVFGGGGFWGARGFWFGVWGGEGGEDGAGDIDTGTQQRPPGEKAKNGRCVINDAEEAEALKKEKRPQKNKKQAENRVDLGENLAFLLGLGFTHNSVSFHCILVRKSLKKMAVDRGGWSERFLPFSQRLVYRI